MSHPDDPHGRSAAFDDALDTPPTPEAGKLTARRDEPPIKSGIAQGDVQTGEYSADPTARTTGYRPSDPTARTTGYAPSDAPKPAAPGAVTVRGYEVLGDLGRGAMGVVYKARQVGLDRLVALKMILAGAHARQADLDRFRAEAQTVARFQHPNIVQIYEVGEAGGLPYFSLEFVVGGTLSGKIAREPQPPKYAAETTEAIARAVQYAHERGVVHRDLKPDNVLVAADGTPKLTDFGLAKRLEQDCGQTQAGTVLGTPSYMAPEQAMGAADRVGPLADVYSLGATLYAMLTGRPPFSGSSVLDTLEMVRTREPVPPGQLAYRLPRDLETICLKCLHKEPHKRYASAGALADDLRRYLDGKPILARPVGPLERAWRWAKRNPWVTGLGSATATSLLAIAVVTSVLSYQLNQKKKDAEAARDKAIIAEQNEARQKAVAEEERDNAKKAKETTGSQRLYLLNSVRGISMLVDNELKDKQSLAPLRMKIQQRILSDIDRIRDFSEKNPLSDRAEGVALCRLGQIYLQANRVQEAREHFKRTRELYIKFIKDFPDQTVGQRNLAAITNLLADAELRLGYGEEARRLYTEGLEIRKTWFDMSEPKVKAAPKESIAKSYSLIANVDLELGEPAKALEHYQDALKTYDELPPESLKTSSTRQSIAVVHDQMAACYFKLGKRDKAEAEHEIAFREFTALRATGNIALSRQAAGDLYLFDGGDVGRALLEYVPAYNTYALFAKQDPNNLGVKAALSALSYRMGFALDRVATAMPLGRDALGRVARSYYEECLALRTDLAKADPKDTHGQINRMVALARVGKTDDVEKVAKALLDQAGKDRRVLFQTACGLAIAAGTDQGEAAERCRKQAFDVLDKLIRNGWKDRVALETDPDLEAVRKDPAFAKLLAKLPKK